MATISFKDRYINFLARTIKPPEYVAPSLLLNLFGLQLLRASHQKLRHHIARAWYELRGGGQPVDPKVWQSFQRDGYVVIPSFFEAATFSRIAETYDRILAQTPYRAFKSGGFIRTVSINGTDIDADKRWIYETFTHKSSLKALVGKCVGQIDFRAPRIVLQDIHMPEGVVDIGDSETEIHPDRIFHHPKLFFSVNAQDRRNGAYIFVPKSHKYGNVARLLYEYRLSVKTTYWHLRQRLKLTKPGERYQSVYKLTAAEVDRLGFEPLQIESQANTAIISNNRGFHARGLMEPGQIRRQVRIQYQYLILPWHARLLLWLTAQFRPKILQYFN